MLFQPTNITPDVINGIGNGTVDVSTGLQVSWQVNGNTAMTAYEIFIYQNNATSTQVYDTGVISITPFYGVDSLGNRQIFTANIIDASTLSTAGITNGNQYKIMIREYWSANDYIDQRSLSVFNARSNPSLTLTAVDSDGNTVTSICGTRSITLTGTYTQAQSDAIEWIRWNVSALVSSAAGNRTVPIFDSGMIYGTGEIEFTYDNMVNGINYIYDLSVQTTEGIVVTARKLISARWATASLPAESNVCKLNGQSTAMRITWGGFSNITGTGAGQYSISDGKLYLGIGNVVWDKQNGVLLSMAAPWAVVMKTTLQKLSVDSLLRVDMASGSVTVNYDMPTRKMNVVIDSTTTSFFSSSINYGLIPYDADITIIITPTQVILRADDYTTGLTPTTALTPKSTLTPRSGTAHRILKEQKSVSYTQGSILRVIVTGTQTIDYIQVLSNYSESDLTALIAAVYDTDNGYDPSVSTIGSTEFLTNFDADTLDAGTLTVDGASIEGWAIYRRKESDPLAIHIADVSQETMEFLDYGCANMDGMYHYEIYPIGSGRTLADAIVTKSFNPCFENWSIIEASYNKDKDEYTVIDEYLFGKNFSSGSISNNNEPTVYKNFTQYPTVLKATPLYQSGTLSSLIGYIGYISYIVQDGDTLEMIASRFDTTVAQIIADNSSLRSESNFYVGMVLRITLIENPLSYYDDKKLRDKIWGLSSTKNTLFLKSRKGDLLEICIAQDLSISTMDNSKVQALTASIPWVQVGNAKDYRIVGSYQQYVAH